MIFTSYFSNLMRSDRVPYKTLAERILGAVRTAEKYDFPRLNGDELKRLLDEIALDLKPKELERLADMIPMQTLAAAVRVEYPEHESALQTAKNMFQEAKYYLATTESQLSLTWKAHLTSILNSLIAILESFLGAFGIADFFKPPETSLDSDFKGQKIMLLLTLFTLLSTILMPLLGPTLGSKVIGGALLTLASTSLIYPLVKPQATKLLRGENLSEQHEQGELFAIEGRKETLDEMARTLLVSHVMLLGHTGIGKTATVKAFVQAVARGDYPELQGKQIFYFNTADLLSPTEMYSNANKIFAQISEAMGRHRDNFVLIFDEIHMACQKRNDGALSEQLKTFLDPGNEKFPHVIGITTEEEYYREIYAHNAAFARRFKRIVIENTDDQETLKILSNAHLKQSPATLLEPDTLQTLLAKTKQAFAAAAQPATSLKILSQCINRTASSQRSPLEKRVDEIRGRLQSIYAQGAGRLPYGRPNEAPVLEAELGRIEEELREAKENIKKLFEDRDRLLEIKKDAMKKILNAENLTPETMTQQKKIQLNVFSLQNHFQARLLEKKIREKAEALNVKVAIDPDLIDEVIAEEIENEQRVREAVERAREQIDARAP